MTRPNLEVREKNQKIHKMYKSLYIYVYEV